MHKGSHLLIDCREVPDWVCHDDAKVLKVMADSATRAGANVLAQVRYHFGHNSPPGFAAVIMLDESHCSAHCYADTHQIAMDLFTCGNTDPMVVFQYILEELDLGKVTIYRSPRFVENPQLVREQVPGPVSESFSLPMAIGAG